MGTRETTSTDNAFMSVRKTLINYDNYDLASYIKKILCNKV